MFAVILIVACIVSLAHSECLDFSNQFALLKNSPHYEMCLSAISKASAKVGFKNPSVVDSVLLNILDDQEDDVVEDHTMLLREAWYASEKNYEVGIFNLPNKQAMNLHVKCDEPEKFIISVGQGSKLTKVSCDIEEGTVVY